MTPLQQAAFKGNAPLVDYLLCHGADVNMNEHNDSYTALMFAAIAGQWRRSSSFVLVSRVAVCLV